MRNETSTRRAESRASSTAMSSRFLGILRQFGLGALMTQLDTRLRAPRLTDSFSLMSC